MTTPRHARARLPHPAAIALIPVASFIIGLGIAEVMWG